MGEDDYFNTVNAETFGMAYGDIFTTYDTLMESGFHYIDLLDGIFVLKDPDSAEIFEGELREKGLGKYQTLEYSTEDYEKNTKPLKNIARIAELFTVSAGAAGVLILFLVSIIQVRERRFEIGVLRAMGMKKSRVARGMVYETGILTLAGASAAAPFPAVSVWFAAGLALFLSIVSGMCAVLAVMRHEPMKILSERS